MISMSWHSISVHFFAKMVFIHAPSPFYLSSISSLLSFISTVSLLYVYRVDSETVCLLILWWLTEEISLNVVFTFKGSSSYFVLGKCGFSSITRRCRRFSFKVSDRSLDSGEDKRASSLDSSILFSLMKGSRLFLENC